WRVRALPPRGAAFPPLPRLGNRVSFDGASEPDHVHGSFKSESDILQNTLPENEKFYFDLSRIIDRNARHADGIFTSVYSHLLAKLAVKRYLHSLIRKRVSSQDSPVKRHSDAVFTDNYSRFRKQMAVKKYLNSVLTGKRSQEELNPAKLRDESELPEPSFSENYDSADELLSHLPL
ncbi:VIP peptides, partial [Dryobates pubescens]